MRSIHLGQAGLAPAMPLGLRLGLLGAATLIVGLGFFAAEHQTTAHPVLEEEELATDNAVALSDAGTLSRRVGLALVGAFGLYCLYRKEGTPLHLRPWLAGSVGLLVVWIFVSFCWSVDPSFSLRRLTAVACCALGAVGIARQLRLEQLARLTLVVTLVYLGIGLVAELAHGAFRPWESGYRFAGTVHPNTQGVFEAYLCLAAISLYGLHPQRRRYLWFLLPVGMVFLILSGSRTSTAAFGIALLAGAALSGLVRRHALLVVWTALIVATGLWLGEMFELDPSGATDVAMMGREEDANQLAGRLPLWTELTNYVEQHPLLGHGYGAFWSASRVDDISAVLSWDVAAAHSSYMELLLGLGLIGLVLAVVATVIALFCAGAECRPGDSGHWFLFFLLVFGVTHAFLESAFVIPSLISFIAACGVCRIALFSGADESIPEIHHVPA